MINSITTSALPIYNTQIGAVPQADSAAAVLGQTRPAPDALQQTIGSPPQTIGAGSAPQQTAAQQTATQGAPPTDIPIGPAYILDLSIPENNKPAIVFWRDMVFADDPFGPAYVLDISPEAFAYYGGGAPMGAPIDAAGNAAGGQTTAPAADRSIQPDISVPDISIRTDGAQEIEKPHECQTCASRKYMDRSNDGSVSFQAPTHISPNAAASAVAAHEGEHVSHENAKAARNGGEVISQTVTLHMSICPECGRSYVSGGETKTVTTKDSQTEAPETGGKETKPQRVESGK